MFSKKLLEKMYSKAIFLDVDGTIIDTMNYWCFLLKTFPKLFYYFRITEGKLLPLEYFISFIPFFFSNDDKIKKRDFLEYFVYRLKDNGFDIYFISYSLTFEFLGIKANFIKSYDKEKDMMRFKEKYEKIIYITDSEVEKRKLEKFGIEVFKVKNFKETMYYLNTILNQNSQSH